ncbi:DUF87 domain-containing protein [Candidatus Woesearchaeota archaeon]|nr:DUF87 domain-containing protein [Candidatus Woesearchaeota archaeon]
MTTKKISVYLGNNPSGEKVFWTPKNENNPHLITVGGSGSGKTETLKAIMLELKNQKINSLIFDFHKDFKVFADNLVQIDKATLHPLEVQINEKPLDVAYKVSKMIANVFSLGEVQEAIIRDAIKEFYHKSGIKDLKQENDGSLKLLPFREFKEILRYSDIKGSGIQTLIAKISVLFDVDFFMNADSTSVSLESIIKQLSVIELSGFPTDEVKALVADLLLNKLINYLYTVKGKSDEYWLYVVIDEAHRMMYAGSPVELLLRESRKYGVGIILASQRPTDFSETILANAGTILAFKASLDKDAVFLSKQLRVPKENFQKLKDSGLGYCLFSSKDDSEKVQITQAKNRPGYKEIAEKFDEDDASELFKKEQERIKKEKEKIDSLVKGSKQSVERIKELENGMNQLQGEVERKNYLVAKSEKEMDALHKENVKLSHENDKLSEKLKREEKSTERAHEKLDQAEAEILFLQNKVKHIKVVVEEEKKSFLTRTAANNIMGKIDFGLKVKSNSSFCKNCFNEVSEKEKYCDFCGEKAK